MAYDLKDVFYLDTSATIAASTAGAGSAQLDLSAYIDPIARGRTKGTGLAIYKVHWSMVDQDNAAEPVDVAEDGTVQFGLIAGLGSGDVATGGGNITSSAQFDNTNNLLISQGSFYGPKSMSANANTTISMFPNSMVMPSTEVPYVIVRDNVCILYQVGTNFVDDFTLSCRLECAQISLDQATLNQLLRTQTV